MMAPELVQKVPSRSKRFCIALSSLFTLDEHQTNPPAYIGNRCFRWRGIFGLKQS